MKNLNKRLENESAYKNYDSNLTGSSVSELRKHKFLDLIYFICSTPKKTINNIVQDIKDSYI